MIRLSRLTDYAIVIVAELARQPGQLLAAAGLSVRTGIPEPTVAKVLKILARAEVVQSARGVNGGYQIQRGPDAISIAELVEAMNGPITLTACVDDGSEDCGILNSCLLRGRWGPVNSAIRSSLEGVSLADMIGAAPACGGCDAKAGAV